jgi:DNA-binding NarL/FixJ family response regulator
MDGIEATRRITASTDVRALILTTFDLDEYVFAALRAGASGFLLKDTLPADLLTAIRVVAAGDALLAPSVTRRLIGEFTRTPPGAGPGPGPASGAPPGAVQAAGQASEPGSACDRLARVLTERELEVLQMVARGMSNAEIAGELTISPATAKTHVAHLLTKLDARDRIQLVIIAYQSGLVAVLYDVDAAFMQFLRHGWGIHALSPGGGNIARVTAAPGGAGTPGAGPRTALASLEPTRNPNPPAQEGPIWVDVPLVTFLPTRCAIDPSERGPEAGMF